MTAGLDTVPTPTYQLSLLGRFELKGPDGPIALTSKKLAALLAFLACTAPQGHSRDKLMTLLWGSHFDAQARQNLRQGLTRLRRVLGDDVLVTAGETVSLQPGAIACDVARFEALLRDGSGEVLIGALDLYKGALLADIEISEEAWTDWIGAQRQRLESLALDAMIKLGEQELQAGNVEHALNAANRAIAVSSLREDAHRLVMRALAAGGRRADALKHYENVVALLNRELAVEPDAVTVSLATELRKPPATKSRQENKSGAASEPNSASPMSVARETEPASALVTGERKHVTAVYIDLRESLERIAERDPEKALTTFEAVLELMKQAVHRYGGTLNSATGDGILALFGVPLAHEDHAVRACYAALHIQGSVKRHARELEQALGIPILIRAGLDSGEVVIRPIADHLRTDYRVMGQTTHVATRLGQTAAPGSLLITCDTLRLVEGYVQVRSLDRAKTSEGLYELVGAESARTRFQALAARGLTRFVGRSAELELLAGVGAKAQRGRGQMVTIIGEAGVGKSRLVYEFILSQRLLGWRTLESACVPHGATVSYHPIIELLKSYFGIELSDDVREVQKKVASRIDPSLAPDLPALMALLDIPVAEASWRALDPLQRRQRTVDALKRLIFRQCQEQPLILVCEDLHWVDNETQALLNSVIDNLASAPLLLILTYRPEFQHLWHGKSFYTQLRLDDLSQEATEDFVTELVGNDPSLCSFKILLPKNGHPLYFEETVRALVEKSILRGTRGSYRLVGPLQGLGIPPSVQAILSARIDRLPIGQKRLLQAASVIGKEVPHAVLHPIVNLEEDELRRGLAKLREAEFLYESRLFPDLEYAFKHALTHEVAYRSLFVEERTALHRQIVDIVERLYPDRLLEQVEQLAHHAMRAELWEKAAAYARQAGKKAHERWALHDARAWFEKALWAVERLRDGQVKLELQFEIRLELRPVLSMLGEVRRGRERLQEAEALADRLKDDRRRARVCAFLTNSHSLLGELDQARASGTRALQVAGRVGDLRTRILASNYLLQLHYFRGEYQALVERAMGNIAEVPGEWLHETFGNAGPVYVDARAWLVLALAELGRFAEASRPLAEAFRVAENTHHAFTPGMAHWAAATLHLFKGEWDKAHSVIEDWVETARSGNVRLMLARALAFSAWTSAQRGEINQALGRVRESELHLEELASKGIVGVRSWTYHALGRACLLLDKLGEAQRLANRALESSVGHLGFAAHATHLLGDVTAHAARFNREKAERQYHKALAIAEPRGMRPLVAHCNYGLGKLYQGMGARKLALEHTATARTMYRDLGMTILA